MKSLMMALFVLALASTASFASDNQFEFENSSSPKLQSTNSLRVDFQTNIPDQGEDNVNVYTHTEADLNNARSFAGLIYHSAFGLFANIGVGLWQHESSPAGNLGLGYQSAKHEVDLQADIASGIKFRGSYNYLATSWLKFGLYGRSEFGLGPRVVLLSTGSLGLGLAYTYNPDNQKSSAIAQLLIKF